MPYLGRAVTAPPRRNPLPTPFGPSRVPDFDSGLPPWDFDTPKGRPRTLPPLLLVPPPAETMLPLPVEDKRTAHTHPRRRPPRAAYDALESHGRFELTDTGELTGGSRAIVLRLPRRSRGVILEPRVGDVICANAARDTHAVGGRLDVQFVTRHK